MGTENVGEVMQSGDFGLAQVGKRIRQEREAAGISMDQLGKMVGKNVRTISDYETGSGSISVSTLIKIANALGVHPSVLLGAGKKKGRSMEIRVYQLEDRMAIAPILLKNGYTVSLTKKARDSGKTVDYCLKLEESDSNLRIAK